MRTLVATFAAALLLAGCGVPGAPLPPSLDLPQPPADLQATRKGDKVTLTWTAPAKTTDGALVKHVGEIKVCRSLQPVMDACAEAVGDLQPGFFKPGAEGSYVHTLAPDQQSEAFATYAVEVLNARGRSAGLSNQVRVPLARTFPAPQVSGRVTPDGPEIRWRPMQGCFAPDCVFRVRRRLKDDPSAKEAVLTDVEDRRADARPDVDYDLKFTDQLAEWEKTYIYRATPITRVQQSSGAVEVEGEDSAPVEVFAHDSFPPAAPSGVQAVYSGLAQQKFIDLTWAPNTDPDLAGYQVYRREEGGELRKISTEVVKTPAFRDADTQPGRTYYYAVTAVDLRGNEGAKSPEASERVPQ